MSELGDCPFCGSVDVGGVNRNGLMYFDCYGCGARVHFLPVGLSVDDQKGRFQRRAKVAELEARWVAVEDGLPDFDTPVLVISGDHPDSIYAAMRIDEGDGWLWCEHTFGPIGDPRNYEFDDDYQYTHWMPLPSPPTEDKSDAD